MTWEDRVIKLIDLFLYIVIPLFIIGFVAYMYFSLPNHSQVYVTGDLIEADELADVPEGLNLYGVSVRSITVEDRFDFIKFWWEDKKVHTKFAYRKFTEGKAVKDQVFEDVKQSLEAEKEAGIAIIEYVFDHYGEAEAVELLGEFSRNEDYLGDSATLLIITALLGVHEDKAWIDADEKIVITGSFDKDGNVLPVGGVALKAMTAEEKEADIFIVPKEQMDAAYTWVSPNSALTVVGVETLDELIAWLDENVQ